MRAIRRHRTCGTEGRVLWAGHKPGQHAGSESGSLQPLVVVSWDVHHLVVSNSQRVVVRGVRDSKGLAGEMGVGVSVGSSLVGAVVHHAAVEGKGEEGEEEKAEEQGGGSGGEGERERETK